MFTTFAVEHECNTVFFAVKQHHFFDSCQTHVPDSTRFHMN